MAELSDQLLSVAILGYLVGDDVLRGRVRVRPPWRGRPGRRRRDPSRRGRRRRRRVGRRSPIAAAGAGLRRVTGLAGRPVRGRRPRPIGRAASAGSRSCITGLGVARARGVPGHPRSRGGPGAVGQHVRVRHRGHAWSRRSRGWAGAPPPVGAAARPVRHAAAGRAARLDRIVLYTKVAPLVPALNSYWLKIHVTLAITASGLLLVGFCAAALHLVRAGYEQARRSRSASRTRSGPPARGRQPGAADLPDPRVRVPDLDARHHLRRDLGRGGLGPLLGLGPEGDLVVHRLGGVRRYLHARATPSVQAHHRDLARGRRLGRDDGQPVRDQLRRGRPALLRRAWVTRSWRCPGFPYADLKDFLAALEHAGELHRVPVPVDPTLEISEIVTRTVRATGPALLFEKPTRGDMPVAINLFGTERRMAMALGVDDVDEIGARIGELVKPELTAGLGRHPRRPGQADAAQVRTAEEGQDARPARRSSTRAPRSTSTGCPACRPGPDDGGVFHNFGLTHTKHPETGKRNLGLYRLQQHSPQHARHALADPQGLDRPPRGRRAPRRAAAGGDRDRLRPGRHLRRHRAAAGRHRRVPVRRLPARRAGRDGRLPDRAAAGAGARADRAGGVRRAGRARTRRARSATTPASTRRSSRSRCCTSRR